LLCGLSACTATPPAPAPAPEPAAAPAPAPAVATPPVDIDRLDALLERGDEAMKAGRLLTPIDDCAYDYYREALALAPDHPAAQHGLQRLAERFVGMAEQAAERGQFDTARSLLERARIVSPKLDSIAAAQAQIDLRSSAPRSRVALDPEQLSAHTADVAARLNALGARAKAEDAWVIIRARSDAEGRWIYQQMARAPGDRRIRAELTLGAPGVELLQLNPNTSGQPQ
jgi:tetratricopeptide (TPR) repeat protein